MIPQESAAYLRKNANVHSGSSLESRTSDAVVAEDAAPFVLRTSDGGEAEYSSSGKLRSDLGPGHTPRALDLLTCPENGVSLAEHLQNEDDYGYACLLSSLVFPIKAGLQAAIMYHYLDRRGDTRGDGEDGFRGEEYIRKKSDGFNSVFLMHLPYLIESVDRASLFGKASPFEYYSFFKEQLSSLPAPIRSLLP